MIYSFHLIATLNKTIYFEIVDLRSLHLLSYSIACINLQYNTSYCKTQSVYTTKRKFNLDEIIY